MRQIKLVTIPSIVILTLMLAAVNPGMVRAADDPVSIEFTGTVTQIGEPAGAFGVDVDTDNGSLAYTVYPPAGFDWETIEVGATVAVEGTLTDNFTVQATKVEVEEDGPIEIEFAGTVAAVNQGEGVIAVDVETDGDTVQYLVYVPDGFDWEAIEVGDTVEVEGTLIGELTVDATKVEVEEDEPIEIEFTGTITDINEDGGTITVEVETNDGTEQYVVEVPEDFDWEGIEIGDLVEVEGWLQDDGTVIATRIVVEDEDDDDDDDGQGDHGHYCRNVDDPDIVHPVGGAIAERYDVNYEEVMYWFCEESMGFGQIMLALQTADDGDVSYEEYLDRRLAGEGWGQIWKDLGLIGRLKDAEPPEGEELEDSSSSPQIQETGNGADKDGKTTGKPDKADEPDKPDKVDKADKPDKTNQAGPPDKPDKPDKAGKPDKPDKSNKPDKSDKPDKSNKPDKASKPEKPDKPAKSDK
jgi:hypothetical protein